MIRAFSLHHTTPRLAAVVAYCSTAAPHQPAGGPGGAMPGSNDRSQRWPGGYVRTVGEGSGARRIYIIHRMVDGHRYEISTKRSTEPEAYAQLVIFEKNPAGYTPTPPVEVTPEGPPPVYLDATLAEKYLDHCKDE